MQDLIFFKKEHISEHVRYRRNDVWWVGWGNNEWSLASGSNESNLSHVHANNYIRRHGDKFDEIVERFEKSSITKAYVEDGILLTVEGVKVAGEVGTVTFTQGVEDPRIGLTNQQVFVDFNLHTVDTIPLQPVEDYHGYLYSEEFKQKVRDSYIDRMEASQW